MRCLILTFLRRCICIRMQCLKCVFQACSLPLCAFMRVSHWLQPYVLSECNVLNIDARQCLTSLGGGWCKGCGSNSRLLGSCSILLTFLPPGPYYPSFLPGLCRLIAPLNAPYISPSFFSYLKPWDILCHTCCLLPLSVHLSNRGAACSVDTK